MAARDFEGKVAVVTGADKGYARQPRLLFFGSIVTNDLQTWQSLCRASCEARYVFGDFRLTNP